MVDKTGSIKKCR